MNGSQKPYKILILKAYQTINTYQDESKLKPFEFAVLTQFYMCSLARWALNRICACIMTNLKICDIVRAS